MLLEIWLKEFASTTVCYSRVLYWKLTQNRDFSQNMSIPLPNNEIILIMLLKYLLQKVVFT